VGHLQKEMHLWGVERGEKSFKLGRHEEAGQLGSAAEKKKTSVERKGGGEVQALLFKGVLASS